MALTMIPMNTAAATETQTPVTPSVLDRRRILFGDLVFDLAEQSIHSRPRTAAKLSANEFKILATLVKQAGRYVSRSDLTEAMRDNYAFATKGSANVPFAESTIDIYVKFLRQRFQDVRTSATIENGYELGYRLVA